MDIDIVRRLVAKGEGQRLEFKKKVNFPEKIIKEVVAFANTDGGKLLLGIDDDGTISGVRNIEGEIFLLEDAIKKYVSPTLTYTVRVVKLNPKKGIAVFDIPEGSEKPYRVEDDPKAQHGKVFVRNGDESVRASKEMRQILKRRNGEKDQQFNFGDKEKVLMQLLADKEFVTLDDFASEASIPKFIASKTLVKLVLANLLDIKPCAGKDRYFAKTD